MKIPKARKLASGMWYVQLRINGQSFSVTAETEKKAQAKALAIKTGIVGPESAPGRKTLGRMLDEYIDSRSNVLSPSTINGYKCIRNSRFQAYMDRTAASVNWQSAINLEAKTCSPKTLKNAWGLIKSALKENNIEPDVALPAVSKTPMPWLTPEQIPIFLEAARGEPCELPALLGLCSLRRSEIFGLDWSDIDLERKIIHVHAATVMSENGPVHKQTTKTSASTRTVPIIIPRLLELLNGVEDKTGPVCTCFIGTPYRQIINVCKSAGLPEIGMHGLRRSFASLGYHLGLSELEIMSIGGWNDFQTVHKFYLYLSEADRQKSADKLTSFFSDC